MPPKKAPSSLASQKSLLPTQAATPLGSSRAPLAAPVVPPSDSLAPLWSPTSRPREVFAEWPTAAALAAETWSPPGAPFEDALPLSELFVPLHPSQSISWKRPSQFMPAIVDPVHHAPVAPVTATPSAPEPKAPPAKKGAAAPAAKKPAAAAVAEPEPAKKALPPPKHAHVFYTDPHHHHHHHDSNLLDHVADHKRGAPAHATPASSSAGATHAASAAHPPHSSNASTAALHHPPGSSASHSVALEQQQPRRHCIPRDFRRLWSPDERDELAKWRVDEARIERESQARERVYMAFEDAIAYIVNDRPRGFANDDDIDADDLVDDGQDDDEGTDALASGADDVSSNDSSPWGVLPPPRIEIAPNVVTKPECPHGDVVHGAMASLFRIVEQLYDTWTSGSTGPASDESAAPLAPPFLWQAIYPQDASGTPVYNPSGKYAVKLFVLGKWRRVDIDDRLPVDDADNAIAYVTSSMRSEIWPALLAKALFKVLHWLYGAGLGFDEDGAEQSSGAPDATSRGKLPIRVANTVISALTGWKVSRWTPSQAPSAAREPMLQQLLEFIPVAHSPDESADAGSDASEPFDDAPASASSTLLPRAAAVHKPRAVVCSTLASDTAALCAGEVALVTDIVGDAESTMLKLTGLRGAASIPEELIAAHSLAFLLVHPPTTHSDLLMQQWTLAKSEAGVPSAPVAASSLAAGDASSGGDHRWTPFANPPTQFVQLALPKHEQAVGDASSEALQTIDAVFTLTRIPPVDAAAHTQDARLRAAAAMAAYAPAMDPHGSVVLIEEHRRDEPLDGGRRAPLVVTLDTSTSTRVALSLCNRTGDVVFRVSPQASLCYGYSIQVESSVAVAFYEPSTYWRNACDVQVVNSEGTYSVLRPHTWSVLFKHTIELAPPAALEAPAAGSETAQTAVELYLDLHLSDAMLVPFVHVSIVNDATGETRALSALSTVVALPVQSTASLPCAWTIVVDCAPQTGAYVPEGKWHLTLGSPWLFRASSSHVMKLSAFEAQYEANKPLLLFRDVVVAPKKPLWTSFELTLRSSESGSMNDVRGDDADDALVDALALKLEVIDAGTEQVLSEATGRRTVRLLQLPRRPPSSDERDDAGTTGGQYILQGVLDKTRCAVPAALCSVRPFRNRVGSSSAEARESSVKESATEDASDGAVATSLPSARAPTSVVWRLSCWNADDVKLDVDRTKENRFDAIRASWADAAKDRLAVTNGAVSRLLFLGKPDAADAKVRQDGVSDDLAKRIRARFEWLDATASASAGVINDGPYLARRVRPSADASAPERMMAPEELDENDQVLASEIDTAQQHVAQQREADVAANEQRAQEVKDLVQSIREQRSAALKHRATLWQHCDAVLHPRASAS